MATIKPIDNVVVHPLVLLSVTDHFYRVAKDTSNKRVVGVLLGESFKGRLDVTNSFAVPFEEDARDPSIFFLDHDYVEAMFAMFKKVAAKERVVGFYSTGPRIRPADLQLDALFRRYCTAPVLVIVDVRPTVEGLPTQAYQTVEVVSEGRETVRSFSHLSCEVGAYEAEEVGVEHLLRDINDPSVSSLGEDVRAKLAGVKGLVVRLKEITTYLEAVLAGKLPVNNDIMYNIQSILALLPNMSVESTVRALQESSNDEHLVMYTASLVRAVLALHDLVSNKIKYKGAEDGTADEEKAKVAAEKEKADKEKAEKEKADAAAKKK